MNEEKDTKLKFVVIALVLLVCGSLLLYLGFSEINKSPLQVKTTEAKTTISATVVLRVVDGDTVVLSTGEKVRYIGIDTPETVDPRRSVGCFGKEASDENKKLVEGKEVILEKDVSETDKFDRLLRLVYLKNADGTLLFVNDYLVRQGFAKASTYPPDVKFSAQFVAAEREARENLRGLWKKCP